MLTGTPAVNNAAELFPLLDGLLPGLLPSRHDFCARYCQEQPVLDGRGRQAVAWKGSIRPHELHRILVKTVMIRRLKSQVLFQLPEKFRQRVQLDPSKLCKLAMADMAELRASVRGSADGSGAGGVELSLAESLGSSSAGHTPPGPNMQAVSEMARLTCQAKINAVKDYVECAVLAGSRFLLFAHHLAMLDALEEHLERLKVCHIRIDGQTPQARRPTLVSKFQEDDAVKVALLSITACGQGLNLQAASLVIFAELHWVVGQMLQAEDRAHRMGQVSGVNVRYLIAPGTLDEIMHEVLKRKHKDTTATLDGDGGRKLRLETTPVVRGGSVSLTGGVASGDGSGQRKLTHWLRTISTAEEGKFGG